MYICLSMCACVCIYVYIYIYKYVDGVKHNYFYDHYQQINKKYTTKLRKNKKTYIENIYINI